MSERYYFSLGSGSKGNCGLYCVGGQRILIDYGISHRAVCAGLAVCGLTIEQIDAVLITHGHSDHVKGLSTLLKKAELPLYATFAALPEIATQVPEFACKFQTIVPNQPFWIGEVSVLPLSTPHDARGSVGFVLSHGQKRLAYFTDLGHIPTGLFEQLAGCDAAVFESNYDANMLAVGPYPYALQRRISGAYGHLSNADSAAFCKRLAQNGLKTLVLAHLSENNNMPELALQQMKSALAGLGCRIEVAPPKHMEAPILLDEEQLCLQFG